MPKRHSTTINLSSIKSARMAESGTTSHLWEPGYDEKWKSSVIDDEVLLDTLAEKQPAIMKNVELGDKFWSLLLQRGVVNEETKSRIQGHILRKSQAASLVQHVMSVEVYKFHGFIWALVNSNQCHLAELLGFAVHDYLDVDVFLMSSAFQCPACHEIYNKAYVLTGCGHYVCAPCVKGAQFLCKDNKKEDVTCPVPECGKITEASASDGKIGLEEDGDFSDLCEAMLNEVAKKTAVTTEGQSTAENEEEDENSSAGSKEKEGMSTQSKGEEDKDEEEDMDEEEDEDNLSQCLQEGISGLEVKISCLQKYKDILGKNDPGVKDHVVGIVEKVKQDVDEWAKDTVGWYSSVCQQVEKNLQKSVQWKNAASQLSVLVTARPGFLEGCLKGKINLPKETVTDAGEKVITKLDSGCSIPLLFPYGGCGEQTFSYTVESISKLTNSKRSPPCMVRNMPWIVSVQPDYNEPSDQQKEKSMAVYLETEVESESLSWSCDITAELRLLSWKKDGRPYTRKFKYTFNSEENNRGYASFLLWNELMDPENGYVKGDSIRLEVHVIAGPLTWREKSSQEYFKKIMQMLRQISDSLEKPVTRLQKPGE